MKDWVKDCVSIADAQLMNLAIANVAVLPKPNKFTSLHISKAEVATWLAWQKKPGHGMHQIATESLLNTAHPKYVALTQWLKHLF